MISKQLKKVFDHHLKSLENFLAEDDYESAMRIIQGSERSLEHLEGMLDFNEAEEKFISELREHWDIVLARCHKELGTYH